LAPEAEPIRRAERRLLTVLFADLSGFTALVGRMDPEEAHQLVAPTVAALARIAEEHGATIVQIEGDGFLAVFGAPNAHEDDPERAVRAALVLRDHQERARAADPTLPQVHTGISTGEVLVSPSDAAPDFTLLGDPVNLASRLSDAAPAGTVVTDESTWVRARHAVSFETPRRLPVKGKTGRVVVVDAIESLPHARGGRPQAARLDTTPFVGRERERRRVLTAIARVRRDGHCSLLAVEGEAGIGKSRLAAELRAHARGVTWIEGRCAAFGPRPAFSPLADMVAAELERRGGGPETAALRTLRKALPVRDGSARQLGPARDAEPALRRGLEVLARTRPLVAVIDDLHWAGPDLCPLLEGCVDDPPAGPILLLCLGRPEGPFASGPSPVELGSLEPASIERLAAALVGGPIDPALATGLARRVGGNPLFLEESIRLLVERGDLVDDAGVWRLRDGATLDVMPGTLVALLAARIDALPAAERETLRSLSIAGDGADRGLLISLGARSPERSLRRLNGLGLVVSRQGPRGKVSSVRHPLVRDVAEAGLTHAERAAGHATVATRLEERGNLAGAARHALTALDLSSSRLRTERADEAARAALGWGNRAFGTSRREAEEAFGHAAGAARLTRAPRRDVLLASALSGRAEARIDLARHEEARADAGEALRCAERIGDETANAVAELALGRVASDLGDIQHAEPLLRDALARFERTHDLVGQGWAWHRLSEAARFGDRSSELPALEHAVRLFSKGRDRVGLRTALLDLAFLLVLTGGAAFDRALARARREVARSGDPRSRSTLLLIESTHAFWSGRPGESLRLARAARGPARDAGDRWNEVNSMVMEADALAALPSRDPQEAARLAAAIVSIARAARARHLEAFAVALGALPAARIGRVPDARRRITRARRLMKDARADADLVFIDVASAEVELVAGRADRAARDALAAEEAARALGWDLVAARAARLARRAGRAARG